MSKIDQALIGTDTTGDLVLLRLPRGVRHLLTELVTWSCAMNTDGVIEREFLGRVGSDEPDLESAMESLVVAGRLDEIDVGWLIVDFSRYGVSSDYKARRREQSRVGITILRDHALGDFGRHDQCRPTRCKWAADRVGGGVSANNPANRSANRSANNPANRLDGAGVGYGVSANNPAPESIRSVPSRRTGNGYRIGSGPQGPGRTEPPGLRPLPGEGEVSCVRCGLNVDEWLADWPFSNDDDFVVCPGCAIWMREVGIVGGGDSDKLPCAFLNQGGLPCGSPAMRGAPYCMFHREPATRGTNPEASRPAMERFARQHPERLVGIQPEVATDESAGMHAVSTDVISATDLLAMTDEELEADDRELARKRGVEL